MDKLDILMWVIGAGFTFNFALMLVFWNHVNGRFKSMENRLEKIDEKITDIDRRLCRLEGAFSSKECCMLSSREPRRAE